MTSPRYKAIFPHVHVARRGNVLEVNRHGKRRFLTPTGQHVRGADIVLLDSPIDAINSLKANKRAAMNAYFDNHVLPMLNNPAEGALVVVTPRMHADDLTNHLLRKQEGWVQVSLPAIAMRNETWDGLYGNTYTRKQKQPLHPERVATAQLIDILHAVGGYAFSYQYLQGKYSPECGESGRTTRWLSSLREGVFWDGRKDPMYELAWVHLSEKDFILPRVFGIGDDPCPPDMRTDLTMEEWEIGYAQYMKDRERLWQSES